MTITLHKANQSRKLFESAQEVLATGVSSSMRRAVTSPPLYLERASGPNFYDVDGRQLLDYTLGWGPLIAGSNHPRINEAVTQQLARGYTFGAQHEGEIRLARGIVSLCPGVEQVIFANTGTEAVQAAVRIARARTGRDKLVKFEGHYHGWMNNVLVSYRPRATDPVVSQATCGGQPASEFADTLVLPWNDPHQLLETFAKYRDQIACVICEPLLANSGCCEPAEGWLDLVIQTCQRHGAISVFDEVITGFRLALGGAREYYRLQPDLSVYGKALGGGFPVAAVAGSTAVFEVLTSGKTIHAGTYNGNPICLAAAEATLGILSEPGTFERMHAHGQAIIRTIRQAAAEVGQTLVVCGADTVFSVHFGVESAPRNYRDTLRTDMEKYSRFRQAMLEREVYLLPDGRWYIGSQHGEGELAVVLPAIQASIRDAQGRPS